MKNVIFEVRKTINNAQSQSFNIKNSCLVLEQAHISSWSCGAKYIFWGHKKIATD
jgi:hypothetical protein